MFPSDPDWSTIRTPCFVVDEESLARNLALLDSIRSRTGCRVLLALKAFAMVDVFPLVRRHLDGSCASSPHEARLGCEELGGEVHAFAAAFSDADMADLLETCDHITFNSFSQWRHFQPVIARHPRRIACGLRVNPEHSEVEVPLYDPCAPGSRLGIRAEQFRDQDLDGLSGLHFHTLCELNADALERTLAVFERKFSAYLRHMDWLNVGGGHHITRNDYDVDLLCRLLNDISERYNLQVYIEPGEAVALNTGVLVSRVLDIVHNDIDVAVLDTSATCHMPDVLEMPYRPTVIGSGLPGALAYTYRLAGLSCLAGDVIGDYSFDHPLAPGETVVFTDMAHYTMVKTTTFNGIRLPDIALREQVTGRIRTVRQFGYEDFKSRL